MRSFAAGGKLLQVIFYLCVVELEPLSIVLLILIPGRLSDVIVAHKLTTWNFKCHFMFGIKIRFYFHITDKQKNGICIC